MLTGYCVGFQGQCLTLRAGYIGEVFTPMEDFLLLYPGGFSLSHGA